MGIYGGVSEVPEPRGSFLILMRFSDDSRHTGRLLLAGHGNNNLLKPSERVVPPHNLETLDGLRDLALSRE